jgi:hypothetical protein
MKKVIFALIFAVSFSYGTAAFAGIWFCSAHSSRGTPYMWSDPNQSVASRMVMQNCQYGGQSCIFDGCEFK